MANIFTQEPIYVSLLDVKESSSILNPLDDDELKILINNSQKIIDDIIGQYSQKIDENQEFIFPVIIEDIPIDIKRACVLICEVLFKNKGKIYSGKTIQQEVKRGNSITYDTTIKDKYKQINNYLTPEIYLLLKKFIFNDKLKTQFFSS